MSLRFFLTDRVTIQRNTPTKDSSGAQTDSWAAIASNIRAKVYSAGSVKGTDQDFLQREFKGNYVAVLETNPSIKPKDRIKFGSQYFEIHQGVDYSHPAITSQTVYVVDCSLRTI
jgi:head-tail adaptor